MKERLKRWSKFMIEGSVAAAIVTAILGALAWGGYHLVRVEAIEEVQNGKIDDLTGSVKELTQAVSDLRVQAAADHQHAEDLEHVGKH